MNCITFEIILIVIKMTNELKNDKQIFFNQVKGYISELNKSDIYCSITLDLI